MNTNAFSPTGKAAVRRLPFDHFDQLTIPQKHEYSKLLLDMQQRGFLHDVLLEHEEKLKDIFTTLCSRSLYIYGVPATLRSSPLAKDKLADALRLTSEKFRWFVMPNSTTVACFARLTFSSQTEFELAFAQLDREGGLFVNFSSTRSMIFIQSTTASPVQDVVKKEWAAALRPSMTSHWRTAAPLAPSRRSLSGSSQASLVPAELKREEKKDAQIRFIPEDQPEPSAARESCLLNICPDFLESQRQSLIERQQLILSAQDQSQWMTMKNGTRCFIFKRSACEKDRRLCLGYGTEGTVWLGQACDTAKTFVAVKQYNTDKVNFLKNDVSCVARIQRHGGDSNLVRYYCDELSDDERYGFISMELGMGTLCDRVQALSRYPWSPNECKGIFRDLVSAVEGMHTAGVVHRDIRPQNVLVLPNGGLRLSDLGFSRSRSRAEATKFTQNTGDNLQPFEVLSSEDEKGAPVRESIDIFMLGMTMCYVATGGLFPFRDGRDINQKKATFYREPPKLSSVTDPHLRHLLFWMLDHDESRRPRIDHVRDHPYFCSHEIRKSAVEKLHATLRKDVSETRAPLSRALLEAVAAECPKETANWKAQVPEAVRQAIPIPIIARNGTPLEDLVTFVRNGCHHLHENLVKSSFSSWESVLVDDESKLNWSTVHEFFFMHSSVAWFLPVYYRLRCHRERLNEEENQLLQALRPDDSSSVSVESDLEE